MRPLSGLPAFVLVVLAATGWAIAAPPATAPAKKSARIQEPKEFDRLDGRGPSGKKIDVIEWEGNLEIHSYPKGVLRSLGMKIDRESKTTKNAVMVIEYGFHGVPYTLIRRAMLTIKMPDQFKAFRDTSAEGYDKIIISANELAGTATYALAPAPSQLYPDHHPELKPTESKTETPRIATEEPAKTYHRPGSSESREPASPGVQLEKASEVHQDQNGTVRRRREDENEGDAPIRNFAF